ncbi:MAG: RusA family crossover junction endodeoxyribonuclease [Caldilineaceae bacterium]
MDVNENFFHSLLIVVPPTSNTVSGKGARRIKQELADWINSLEDVKQFAEGDKLFGRIFYFNHESRAARDIHNIIKPLFDVLEGKIIHDDKQICHFEGMRLDMAHSNSWFELEYRLPAAEIQKVLKQTCCLVQISKLPALPPSSVTVKWLQGE